MMLDRQIPIKYSLNLANGDTMNGGSDWYNGIVQKINGIKNTLDQKDYRKFRLDSLSSVAQRIGQFSPECTQCMSFREDVDRMMTNAGNLAQTDDKERRKSYLSDINENINKITGHLQKKHKLVTEGYYMALFTALGAAVGLTIGAVAFDSDSIGLAIGAGGGVAIGAALDAKAKKEDRILCIQTTTRFSRTARVLLFVGLLVLVVILAFIFFARRNQLSM
jgi:hypothetical protein